MKIVFLAPYRIHETWPFPIDRTGNPCPPGSLPQLAAMLPDHENIIIDGFVREFNPEEFRRNVHDADIVCISVATPYMALNGEILMRLIRHCNKNAKIIYGGPHPTFHYEGWLEKGADYVVRGEGEFTLKELVEALNRNRSLKNIQGIAYKDNGKIVVNEARPLIEDLDILPLPRWDLVDFTYYKSCLTLPYKAGGIEWSRGCNNKCNFCVIPPFWKFTQRTKSPERVMSELRQLCELGVRRLIALDDNFGSDYEKTKRTLEMIIEEEMIIEMSVFIRADTIMMHPDLIELAAKAGVRTVFIGYESLNEKTLNLMGKGYRVTITIEDYRKIYELMKKNGITVIGFFILGFHNAEKELFSYENYKEVCDFGAVSVYFPLKGTKEHHSLEQEKEDLKTSFYDFQGLHSYKEQNVNRIKKMIKNIVTLSVSDIPLTRFFAENPVEANLVRMFFEAYFMNFFNFSPLRLRNFITAKNPYLSANQKVKLITRRYLNKKFIEKLMNPES